MSTTAYRGEWFKERTRVSGEKVSGERLKGASFKQQSTQASCHPPPPLVFFLKMLRIGWRRQI